MNALSGGLTSRSHACQHRQQPRKYRRIKLDAGIIEGTLSGHVLSFKGVPYAAPPINNYRWRAPQPVIPWSNVRAATSFGHDCMQQPDWATPLQYALRLTRIASCFPAIAPLH